MKIVVPLPLSTTNFTSKLTQQHIYPPYRTSKNSYQIYQSQFSPPNKLTNKLTNMYKNKNKYKYKYKYKKYLLLFLTCPYFFISFLFHNISKNRHVNQFQLGAILIYLKLYVSKYSFKWHFPYRTSLGSNHQLESFISHTWSSFITKAKSRQL
jgi:hypothetical protein